MARSYDQVIAENRQISGAQLVSDRPKPVPVVRDDPVQRFIDEKLSEGYVKNPDGSLSKVTRYKSGKRTVGGRRVQLYKVRTTTITVSADGKVTTQTNSVREGAGGSDPLVSKARELESALRSSSMSSGTRQSLQSQLSRTYELIRNRKGDESFYTVSSESTVPDDTTVVDASGKGYSVAPVLQKEFLEKKNLVVPVAVREGFMVPRQVSAQETVSMPLDVETNVSVSKRPNAIMKASEPKDFMTQYDSDGARVTPSTIDNVERGFNSFIDSPKDNSFALRVLGGDRAVSIVDGIYDAQGKVLKGAVAGVLTPAKIIYNFGTEPEAQLQRAKSGVKEVIKDPFGRLVQDPVDAVMSNPLYEGPKLAVETAELVGAGKVAKSIVGANKFTASDVRASAYELSSSSERARVFVKENNIGSGSGAPDYAPIPELTVDVGPFNKNQKYFSNPEIDVPVSRQFTLAGTELKPSVNPKGVLPLEEKYVAPFERNPLTIEQIGKKPLVDASSSAQSRMVDLPVSKSFNKDTVLGDKIVDVRNPSASAFFPDDSTQSTLYGQSRVSGTVKGSDKPLLIGDEKVSEPKINKVNNEFNDFDVVGETKGDVTFRYSDGTVKVIEKEIATNELTGTLQGGKRKLVLSPDYVYDDLSQSYVRKVGDVELGMDIKGKVTPEARLPLTVPVMVSASANIEKPVQINEVKLDSTLKPSVFQESAVDTKSDQDQSPRSRVDVIAVQQVALKQDLLQEQESMSMIDFKSDTVQQMRSPNITKTTQVENPFVPVLPRLKPERQVRSGFGLFDVLMRKEGKFIKVGGGYSDLATAINRGKQEVKNTARASFKVVSRFGETAKVSVFGDRTLRPSKVDPNVIVQKREYRISSPGEKAEITNKGLFVRSSRRLIRKDNKNKKGVFG